MKVQYLITLFLFLSTLATQAQDNNYIDSLENALKGEIHDSIKGNIEMELAELLYLSDIESALDHLVKAERIWSQSKHNQTTLYISNRAECLNNLGYLYFKLGSVVDALECFHTSITLKESIENNQVSIAQSYNNLAYIYRSQQELTKSLEYFKKSLEIRYNSEDKKGLASTLNNLGILYKEMDSLHLARNYFSRSLKLRKEINDSLGIANSLSYFADIYKRNDSLELALETYLEALEIRKKMNDKEGIMSSYRGVGYAYYTMNLFDSAKLNTQRSFNLAQQEGYVHQIEKGAQLLYRIYKEQELFDSSLKYYETHIIYRDSLKNEETQKATVRQQTKYEFEKAQMIKEQEEKELERLEAEETSRRNNLQYSIILIGILALFGSVLALGYINVSVRMAEGIIFFSFLILFEFLLVLADPYIEGWSGGAPGIKLLFNAGIAALIFPAHAFFEDRLKRRLVKKYARVFGAR